MDLCLLYAAAVQRGAKVGEKSTFTALEIRNQFFAFVLVSQLSYLHTVFILPYP